ncbi:uncharacterized protein LOC125759945 [Rhipicephalus sanguineus]|uniref:uncharacterized protein LOC125759945 n=1 Tax=Rhipicephalus sanguineus TaxID=34632 RepID=UPI0020C1C957|nr:uncharacterized protein LOC125759945 [Rhipicephalus sanguineus]
MAALTTGSDTTFLQCQKQMPTYPGLQAERSRLLLQTFLYHRLTTSCDRWVHENEYHKTALQFIRNKVAAIRAPPLQRLTEEQAFLRIYQLLVAYTTFAQHMANTSHGVASCSGHAIAANSKRSAAGAATALQVATNSQRNADQLQELRCDVRLSSAAHGSQAQFAAADASAVGLILDTYVDCSKRLLAHYSVAVGVQQLLHSMRGYLLHLVRLKSPYPGADNAEAPEVFEQASY